ncbi:MAG: ribulose-phosphate 3-epimerase [Sphaerochaetaceae bacterium]|nr:ribulose-phosphate 3-epimerase [Spirochaetales bacterium]MDY5968049.1 ribulose-phosphate 3-epimerase [Sphaerochaetaceae bacterium]
MDKEHKTIVSPSLLAFDFSDVRSSLRTIKESSAPWVHFDVMDGHFVPPITFGSQLISSSRPHSDLFFDTHLMVEKPENFIDDFAKAGSDAITVHYESTVHLNRVIGMIKKHSIMAGVSIVPSTPVSALSEILEYVDLVLVMSVNPGWGGQNFIPSSLNKIKMLDEIRQIEHYSYKISVDGGVTAQNAEELKHCGADILVTGSSFVKAPDKRAFVEKISY